MHYCWQSNARTGSASQAVVVCKFRAFFAMPRRSTTVKWVKEDLECAVPLRGRRENFLATVVTELQRLITSAGWDDFQV
eukprot:2104879-Rhodomonas_salina.1